MKATAMLRATGLNTYYGDSHVLHDVDFRIDAGEAVGLLGRNGMGKTTLIRSLLGFVPVARGTVHWGGRAAGDGRDERDERDITRLPPERRARLGLGYVPEGRGIFPNLSVRENLLMSARPGPDGQRDWTWERVLELFPRLAERLRHGGQQLSGGEQQMLAIGRALLTNPTLLILDEATEGLAPKIVAEIWRVIALVRASGMGILVVDRNYRAVLAHSDRAVVLEKGRVVRSGNSAELAAAPEQLARTLGV